MNARFDQPVWSGIERRLADVEAFIPDAPPWRHAADAVDEPRTMADRRVRAGSAFGRPGTRLATPRRKLVLVLAVGAALLALIGVAALVGTPREQIDRLEQPFGPFGIYRSSDPGGSAAVLPDGRVLIASGTWMNMGEKVDGGFDIWDPANGRVWTGTMGVGRISAAATLLLDGRVLITGGFGGPYAYGSSAVAAAELLDPNSQAFSATGSMAWPRVGHTATLLPDGRVLVIGGTGPDGIPTFAEIWDPATETFHLAGRPAFPDGHHAATLLPSGDVLTLGASNNEIWRAATESFVAAPSGLAGNDVISATPLLDGRLLVFRDAAPGRSMAPPVAFIVSEEGGATPTGTLLRPRARFATTLLRDGRVLITGGVESEQGPGMTSVEVFDPRDGSFHPAPALAHPVHGHQALLLPDGRVLIVYDENGPEGQAEPFIYDPVAARSSR